ncbi:hypothetical protein E5S69_29460 [Cupriavidus necator]|uniref:hypothetical protein n=1 Tax=Cupriavidus necator TaxID=106590 RepID=UPI00148FCDD5|nr:hypothetical protein [Cupriavidus necator]NOV27619.1 hypothetical protein [Cupriavidus necator]
MCVGNVIVRGRAVISGMIAGDSLVDGGTAELRSMVKGHVYESSGQFHGGPTAQILGKRIGRSAAA